MYDAGHQKPVLCDNLEGEGGGIGGPGGRRHMYVYGWLMLMYDKNHHNIVKLLSAN